MRRTINPDEFTNAGLVKLINRDLTEINHLSDRDIISLWSFFKFCITERKNPEEEIAFLTSKNTIIHLNQEILEKNLGVKIKLIEEMRK